MASQASVIHHAPSLTEVTFAEVEGQLLQLKNSSDPSLDVYVRAEGVLFQQLQIPVNLIHPDAYHRGNRVIVKDLPSRKSLHGGLWNSLSMITEAFFGAHNLMRALGQSFSEFLPNFLSNPIFNVDTQSYMFSLCDELKKYPAKILAWHPYVSVFAVAHKSDIIFLYDLRVEEWFPEVLETTLQKDITCMSWKPLGGNVLAVGCKLGICLWELSLERKKASNKGSSDFDAWMRYINYPGHDNIVSIAWHPHGYYLASGSADGSIILWSTSFGNGTPLTTNRKVAFLSWSPVGELLFASFLDGKIEVWETQRWISKVITSPIPFRRPIQTACWTIDGRALFLAFKGDQCIRSLSISPNLDAEWFPEEYMSYIPDCTGKTVEQLAIDPTGERLVVCFTDTPLLVVFHAKRPTLVSRGSSLLSAQGIMRGPSWHDPDDIGAFLNRPDPKAVSIAFAKHFAKGALLSLIWEDGQISFLPFYFRPTRK